MRALGVVCGLLSAAALVPAALPAGADAASSTSFSGVIATAPTATLSSSAAGASGDLSVATTFSYSHNADTVKNLTVTLPSGMWVAPAAVTTTCTATQLGADGCPASSQIATGSATISVSDGALADDTAEVALYLMPASGANLAGVGVVITDPSLNITAESSGAFTVTQPASGAPHLALSLTGLPQNATGSLLANERLEIKSLSFTLAGRTASGGQFIRLPTSCTPAAVTFAVDTYAGAADGAGSAAVTPTGCSSLALNPTLTASATRDGGDSGTTFVSDVSLPAGDSALSSVSLDLPATVIGPNAKYAGLDCASTAPFSGCPAVGTVTATTPLSATPLTGTVYLTGSVANLGLGVSFAAPYALSFSGHLTLGSPYVVSFTNLPDFPLTDLRLSFAGGSSAAFVALCAAAGTGTVTETATGFSSASASLSAPLAVAGCPAATPRTASFSFRLTSVPGRAALKVLKLRLPQGLSFNASALSRALKVSGAAYRFKLQHGVLVLSLKRPKRLLVVSIGTAGVVVSTTAPDSSRLAVAVTDEDGKSANLVFTLGLQD